ncbi:MAG: type 1 glutamine amidotransferase [Thermoleophilaceae bacterium]|nr:type 1 glutamine amidotransferase [Thermoleophilaceae bacterium]
MRVLLVVHHRNAAAGVFAEPAREAGHELVEWLPHEEPPPPVEGLDAAIVFGAEAQVDQEDAYPWLRPEKGLLADLLEHRTPLLGVCFGSQLLAEAAGAVVRRAAEPEIGWHQVALTPDGSADPLLGFLPERFESLQWHHYEWLLPPGAVALARSARCLQAFRAEDRPAWGLQFHPEVTEADYGSWLRSWDDDPGAVATGLDPEAIRAETEGKIAAWNDVGREIAERFLATAA